jgi:hypothetical protein
MCLISTAQVDAIQAHAGEKTFEAVVKDFIN